MGSMLLDLLSEQVSIDLRLEGHESLAEASGEGGDWVLDADLSACNLGCVA